LLPSQVAEQQLLIAIKSRTMTKQSKRNQTLERTNTQPDHLVVVVVAVIPERDLATSHPEFQRVD